MQCVILYMYRAWCFEKLIYTLSLLYYNFILRMHLQLNKWYGWEKWIFNLGTSQAGCENTVQIYNTVYQIYIADTM